MYKLCLLLVAIIVGIAIFMATINGGYWLGCTITLGTCLKHPIATLAAVAIIAFIAFLL